MFFLLLPMIFLVFPTIFPFFGPETVLSRAVLAQKNNIQLGTQKASKLTLLKFARDFFSRFCSGMCFDFPFDFASKNLVESQGTARASF